MDQTFNCTDCHKQNKYESAKLNTAGLVTMYTGIITNYIRPPQKNSFFLSFFLCVENTTLWPKVKLQPITDISPQEMTSSN